MHRIDILVKLSFASDAGWVAYLLEQDWLKRFNDTIGRYCYGVLLSLIVFSYRKVGQWCVLCLKPAGSCGQPIPDKRTGPS